LRVLNRDLKAAGIPRTDDRRRAVDLHAMQMTLATMLNKAGVAPRTAQEIMRHSAIRLRMATYTDANLLNVSGALDSLPKLSPDKTPGNTQEVMRATGTDGHTGFKSAPGTAQSGQSGSVPVILTGNSGAKTSDTGEDKNRTKPTKKARSEGFSDRASGMETKGFEPSTSALRTQLPSQKTIRFIEFLRGSDTFYPPARVKKVSPRVSPSSQTSGRIYRASEATDDVARGKPES
jgi:hypothetical protein